ncbi:MAG: FAD-dependent oxidoreductase [Armatimonadota bacterium]|nr:FAD-dependent oxidoreductase [Armatimonadota bacterium]
MMKNGCNKFIAVLFGLLSGLSWAAAQNEFCTTKDGSLQAIAQGPRSIRVYWRADLADARSVQLVVNGKPYEVLAERKGNFCAATLEGLKPNSFYNISLGSDGPRVTEKTWCELPDQSEYDLLIIGGTASGTAAAVTAARLGLRVALVEETNRIGGMASNGLGSTDIRDPSRSNGFFEDFRRMVVDFYGEGNGLRYEPRVALAIFKKMVYALSTIDLYLKCEVEKPIVEGTRVVGAQVRDLVTGKSGSLLAYTTIDATHTGDFAAMCGCEFRVGREPRTPEEPHAGVIYFNNATQEILPGSTGEGDNKQQSYAYLMIWKDYGNSGAPLIEKPRFYDPETYRYSPEWTKTWNYTSGRLPNGKFEINQHPFGIDWPCINHEYPVADKHKRRAIEEMYRDRALGYLYFFQNERGHKNLGLADDEFLDNDNFPVSLYVREARRIMGEYLFKECDVSKAREFYRADSIGIGDYPMDSHATEDLKDPNRIDKGEGEFWLRAFTPWYQIPYGVIVPKRVDGLLVSTAVSATHVGYGTLRMEPVRMSLGQAAGTCAYWSKLYSISPRRVRAAWIQDRILSQYGYITWNSDITRDSRHFKAINFIAARGIFRNEPFEPDKPLTLGEAVAAVNRLLSLEGSNETFPVAGDPERICSRGEFANLLVAAKQKTSPDWIVTLPPWHSYDDVPPSSPYYGAVETLKVKRISANLFDRAERWKFKPNEPITRADAAVALYLAHRAYAMNYWLP